MPALEEVPSCACARCVNACKRNPGWMLPAEAAAAIDAGLANRLMRDWWVDDENIYLLCPATPGCEGDEADEISMLDFFMSGGSKGRCTFLNADNRCEIHESGFKPYECRVANSCGPKPANKLNEAAAKAWDTPSGREVLARWEQEVGL